VTILLKNIIFKVKQVRTFTVLASHMNKHRYIRGDMYLNSYKSLNMSGQYIKDSMRI